MIKVRDLLIFSNGLALSNTSQKPTRRKEKNFWSKKISSVQCQLCYFRIVGDEEITQSIGGRRYITLFVVIRENNKSEKAITKINMR